MLGGGQFCILSSGASSVHPLKYMLPGILHEEVQFSLRTEEGCIAEYLVSVAETADVLFIGRHMAILDGIP